MSRRNYAQVLLLSLRLVLLMSLGAFLGEIVSLEVGGGRITSRYGELIEREVVYVPLGALFGLLVHLFLQLSATDPNIQPENASVRDD